MQRLPMILGFSAALAVSAALPLIDAPELYGIDQSSSAAHKLNDTWLGLNVETEAGIPVGYVSDATVDNVNGRDFLRVSKFHDGSGGAEEYLYIDLETADLSQDGTHVVLTGYFPDRQEVAFNSGKTDLAEIRRHARQRSRL